MRTKLAVVGGRVSATVRQARPQLRALDRGIPAKLRARGSRRDFARDRGADRRARDDGPFRVVAPRDYCTTFMLPGPLGGGAFGFFLSSSFHASMRACAPAFSAS